MASDGIVASGKWRLHTLISLSLLKVYTGLHDNAESPPMSIPARRLPLNYRLAVTGQKSAHSDIVTDMARLLTATG
jgi:hypothetical protein